MEWPIIAAHARSNDRRRCSASSRPLALLALTLVALATPACALGRYAESDDSAGGARYDRGPSNKDDSGGERGPDKRPIGGGLREAGADLPRCGNGRIDGEELCDPLTAKERPGACPASLDDCNDGDRCTLDSFEGEPASCTAKCIHTPIAECCGNGTREGSEECDDGNEFDNDACSNGCTLPGGHLLISEVALSPTDSEFIEIFNPSTLPVDLSRVFLSDRVDYPEIVTGSIKGAGSDLIVQFPDGASIEPGGYLVIARDADAFQAVFGKLPDFEWLPNAANGTPDMLAPLANARGAAAGLTDAGEQLTLFSWNGVSDLVQDLDYIAWQTGPFSALCKTSASCYDGPDAGLSASCYADDTPSLLQQLPRASAADGSLHRCNYRETAERQEGGNGAGGHDETSEPLAKTWARNASAPGLRTPGAPPPTGLCIP